MKKRFERVNLIFFLILCREPESGTRHSCSVPRARSGLSAHLTAGQTAVTAVTLRCEVAAVPRARFYSSQHRSSVP
jgi:hypothetical protein